ncbi:MAG: outer membrane lipoprotein carrier protein LolA [Paludibacteraceae bacterium]|nr:outer membrane lipoprotein carrier protein LolA [Paludibacteraceae bacterium]
MLFAILFSIFSLTANFVQERAVSLMKEPQMSEGILTYKKPNYLKWEYTSPSNLIWEIDGEKGNVNKQVRGLVELIMKSVSGEIFEFNTDFNIKQENNVYILKPQKREYKQLMENITIILNPKTNIADEVIILEKNGDTTKIKFSNVIFEVDE